MIDQPRSATTFAMNDSRSRPSSCSSHARQVRSAFRLTAIAAGISLYAGLPAGTTLASEAGSRVVGKGEFLSRIAGSYCPPKAPTCNRLYADAIYRENPQAFLGSPAALIAGSRLRLPPLASVVGIPASELAATSPAADPVLPRAAAPAQSGVVYAPAASRAPVAVAATAAAAAVTPAPAPAQIPAAAASVNAAAAPAALNDTDSGDAAPGSYQQEEREAAADLQTPLPPAVAGAAPVSAPATVVPLPKPAIAAATVQPASATVVARPAAAAAGAQSASTPAAPGAPVATAPAAPPGRVRVPYIPEIEKKRIREELREEILEIARRENWAQPDAVPEWVKRIHFNVDLLVRGEGQLYESGNSSHFFNFQAINGGAPINTTPPTTGPIALPFLNTTEDRQLLRLRARFGALFTITPDLSFNLRLASGNGVSPVSTNQTLGNDFNKLNILLDRAFIRYQPVSKLTVSLGRVPNPYAGALDLVWDRDLAFDGLNLSWNDTFAGNHLRLSGGGFSVENTDPNYPGNSLQKVASYDKWLAALQLEWSRQIAPSTSLRGDLGFYEFINIEGRLSSECDAVNTTVSCDSDSSRPGFVQKGNTLFAIRDLRLVNPGDPAFQYFGLASPFRVATISAGLDTRLSGAVHLALDAEFARNLAFDRSDIEASPPVNNFGPCLAGTGTCVQQVEIGRDAFQLQARVGYPMIRKRGDWQAQVGYRYVESDAVPDAFTDSDFHLGGTNAKGYYVGASVGFTTNAALGLRYLSATEISGPKLGIDVLQVDVSVSF